ncbi:hypothetical protein OROGR_008361 [Orobanche gracilis]
MAKSKYEYVKTFEVEDEIMPPNIIVVRIDGRDFRRQNTLSHRIFLHFCLCRQMERVLPSEELEMCPIISITSYLLCIYGGHLNNQYDTCFWQLMKSGKTEKEAKEMLKELQETHMEDVLNVARAEEIWLTCIVDYHDASVKLLSSTSMPPGLHGMASVYDEQVETTVDELPCISYSRDDLEYGADATIDHSGSHKQVKNELLYQSFNINYKKDIPEIFRQGTCVYRTEKCIDNGCHVKRPRKVKRPKNIITVHSKNIASRRFWNEQSCLLEELDQFNEDLNKTKPDYVRSFQYESRLMPFTWIVIRIDGCHFQRFSKDHEFEKPNDAQALNLMNSCAACVLEEFMDIVFAYGDSDEYSFVLKKESQLYGRHASEIVSAVVSLFSSIYTMKWNDFLPRKEMKRQPYFDARAVCYPSRKILGDYLAWRQADYASTRTREKNELLDQLSGVIDYYNTLSPMFRHGSSVYWDRVTNEKESSVVVTHCNIIETSFWEAHPDILDDKAQWLCLSNYG